MRVDHCLVGERAPKLHLDIFKRSMEEHRRALQDTERTCSAGMDKLCGLAVEAFQTCNRMFFFGNGGSAADAQHLAAELSVRFTRDRRALAGLALTTDSSVLTACGNDLGFERVYSRQIEALAQSGDVALGISTSGNSRNIILALESAREKGMTAAAFAGRDGGKLRGVADPLIIVPCDDTARIQEMHILLGHILCAEIEQRLGLV
jgi:D-sedoheptulose 7-phosphate isomerase